MNCNKALLGVGALALPLLCLGAEFPPGEMNGTEGVAPQATENCAHELAARLDTRVMGSDYVPVTARPKWELGAPVNYMMVTARDPQGRVVAQMVCRYDNNNQVVSLSPATAIERHDWTWK